MIITKLNGGLGNQMFQYAAGLALAEYHRTVLKLDTSWYRKQEGYEAHNRYALSCFNITEQFASIEEVERILGVEMTFSERLSVSIARRIGFKRYVSRFVGTGNDFYTKNFRFDECFFAQPDNSCLNGNWQSERYFNVVSDLLRLHFGFRYPANPEVDKLAREIQGLEDTAFVHFRRGDYTQDTFYNRELGVLSLEYYCQAVALLRERHPGVKLYVFSDDINVIEKEFRPGGACVYVRGIQSWHAYDAMRLMSMCRHAVIANSTFGWWGAWLISNPGKMIIAPDPWYRGSAFDGADVVPESWLKHRSAWIA